MNAKALGVTQSEFIRIAVARFTLDYTNLEFKLTSKDRAELINEFSTPAEDYINKDYYNSEGFKKVAREIKVKKR